MPESPIDKELNKDDQASLIASLQLQLQQKNAELERVEAKLYETQETLTAIREGAVDALVISGPQGEQIYSLEDAGEPYRLMVESMSEGAATVTSEGVILYCNAALARMLNLPMQKILGTSLLDVLAEQFHSQFRADLAQTSKSAVRNTIELSQSSGSNRKLQYSAHAINKSNDLLGIAIVFTDLTVILAAKDVAVEAQKTAEIALGAKSRFLATVSHEVRTPIAAIIGLIEMIHVSAEGENKLMAKTALDTTQRLLQILNDLLDASSLQAGAVRLEHRSFAVRPIVGDLVQLIQREADKKQNQIEAKVDKSVPENVCGDELRVRQILQNLVFNAVKFTRGGTIAINVELYEQKAGVTILKFAVTDTGIGITEQQQQEIFKPFVQAEDSTRRTHGGTGLGLSISKTLTGLMEGELNVFSEYGKGSTFWALIPFRDDLCKIQS